MGKFINIRAKDGHEMAAWRADPAGQPRGRIVVIQEIFGVNGHIRDICDRFADQGYTSVAPALFDRQQRDFATGYSEDEVAMARRLMNGFDWTAGALDVEAARSLMSGDGPVAIVGFCLGGSIAWTTSAQSGYVASVCFYGGKILKSKDLRPKCPVQMHFGRADRGIPVNEVEEFAVSRPDIEVYLYDAGHGFNCDQRASYDAASAGAAMARTMEFLAKAFEHG